MYKSPSNLYPFAMARGFRTALVWLVTLTLSVSAHAGAALSRCGGMPVVAASSSHQAVAAIGMDSDAGSLPVARTQDAATDCETMSPGVHSVKPPSGDCTASASCGVSAAPALQTPALFTPAVGAASPPPPPAPGFGFFTDAPDRSPRALA